MNVKLENRNLRKKIIILSLSLLLTGILKAQKDSVILQDDNITLTAKTRSVQLDEAAWHPDPKRATMLSAALPGVGQIYNGHWWKAPIIYAGMGVLGYFVYKNNDLYVRYRNAYIDFVDNDPATTRYDEVIPPDYTITDATWFANRLEYRKDKARRDRDLLIISMVGVYVLNIIEANVAAHLHDFNVSDDLSMRLTPKLDYDLAVSEPMIGLSIRLTINK